MVLPQWIIAKARPHCQSLDPLSTAMHSYAQPCTALHSHTQPWTPNYLLCRILWHVIIVFGMWIFALVIFHYQSLTFITNHLKPYYQSPPMDYQSTFFLVIIKPSVEYKRGPIFWLPGNQSQLFRLWALTLTKYLCTSRLGTVDLPLSL